jgi:uncharacterized membrane protein YdbT with pleckstrin-like domain
MEPEKVVYEGAPSQLLNFWVFVSCLLVIPIPYAIWKWLEVKNKRLKLTDQRLIMTEGVFNKTTSEIELYRVRDVGVEEPFFLRIFGVGHVKIHSTDEATSIVSLSAFKNPHWLKDQVRHYAEDNRQKRRWGNDNVIIHDHMI